MTDDHLTPYAKLLDAHADSQGRFPGGCAYCGSRIAYHTPEELETCAARILGATEESPDCPSCGAEWNGRDREGSKCLACRQQDADV